jgi:hypothetical protein
LSFLPSSALDGSCCINIEWVFGREEVSSIESGMCLEKAEPGMALAAATDAFVTV